VSSGEEAVIRLRHGTTRQRAEAILQNGPDPRYKEVGGQDVAEGFSTARAEQGQKRPSPEDYARKKAYNFPNEGGPAIIEIEVPESIVKKADLEDEVRFEARYGLEELLAAWASLSKRIELL
jgi:hypothetical protein